jgi:hypothetical protein
VIEALRPLAQPELLSTEEKKAAVENQHAFDFVTGAVLAPIARIIKP